MYKSPIEIIQHRINYDSSKQFDEAIFTAVFLSDIYVDRNELVKALQYDRNQYEKGFEDGKTEAAKWISVKDRLPEDDENLHFYDDGHIRFTSVLVHEEKRGTSIANRLMIRHHMNPALDEFATDGWVWSRPSEPTHWLPLPEAPEWE